MKFHNERFIQIPLIFQVHMLHISFLQVRKRDTGTKRTKSFPFSYLRLCHVICWNHVNTEQDFETISMEGWGKGQTTENVLTVAQSPVDHLKFGRATQFWFLVA